MALHCFSTIWHCFSNSMATCIQWVLPFHHFWGCYAWLDADRAQYISPSADWRAFLFSLPNFRWKIGTWPHNHHDHGDLRVSPVLRSLRTTITITIISYQELTTTKSWTNGIISLNKQSTHASSPSELKAKSFLRLFCGLEMFIVRVCWASVDVEHAELCTEYYRYRLFLRLPFSVDHHTLSSEIFTYDTLLSKIVQMIAYCIWQDSLVRYSLRSLVSE